VTVTRTRAAAQLCTCLLPARPRGGHRNRTAQGKTRLPGSQRPPALKETLAPDRFLLSVAAGVCNLPTGPDSRLTAVPQRGPQTWPESGPRWRRWRARGAAHLPRSRKLSPLPAHARAPATPAPHPRTHLRAGTAQAAAPGPIAGGRWDPAARASPGLLPGTAAGRLAGQRKAAGPVAAGSEPRRTPRNPHAWPARCRPR
jgi:hypothetical protein